MSITTSDLAGSADAVGRGHVNEARFLGAGDDPRPNAGLLLRRSCRNSPPFSASRTALVATATIWSTLCDSARRRNFDRTWSAACIASGVSARAVEAAGAQPDHFFFAVDHFEGEIRPHPHDDHVQGVGADVDGGKTHIGEDELSAD